MFSATKFLLSAAVAVVCVNAQSSAVSGNSTASATAGGAIPSGLAGLTPCILGCIVPAAAQNNCTSLTDVTCVCTSAQFQADSAACLAAHCSAADVQTALQLQTAQCASVGTPTASATPHTVAFSSGAAIPTGAGAGSNSTGSGTGAAASQTPTAPANGTSPANKPSGATQLVVANSGVTFGLALAGVLAGALVL